MGRHIVRSNRHETPRIQISTRLHIRVRRSHEVVARPRPYNDIVYGRRRIIREFAHDFHETIGRTERKGVLKCHEIPENRKDARGNNLAMPDTL